MRKYSPLFLLLAFTAVRGEVTLPALISNNMLLQQPKGAVWGKADPGEAITLKLGAATARTVAGKDGRWRVSLQGLRAGIAGDMIVAGKNTLTVKNVAVGDVWFCSGQSNMDMPVDKNPWYYGVDNSEREIAAANFPQVRMFTVLKRTSETPVEEVGGKWEVCTPQTVGRWSAVAYFFGHQLYQDLNVPIGLIQSSMGSTAAEAWTPAEVLQGDPEFKAAYYDKRQKELAEYPALKEKYDKVTLPSWQAAVNEAKAAGRPEPIKPSAPVGPGMGGTACALYNGMVFGVTKYPIKGVIWYQGEGNSRDAARYYRLLPAMITSWRRVWNQDDLSFYIVQLANFMPSPGANFAHLRDAQCQTALALPNTGLAVTIDIGDPKNIHPTNKQEVGRRLALVAEGRTYGKSIVFAGPTFDAVNFDGSNAKIAFKPGTAIGLATKDGGSVKGFAIADENREFFWANAKIVTTDKTREPYVVISSPKVSRPVAVRYAWANSLDVNLVNSAGLPAAPFRTDNWPQVEPLIAPPAISPQTSSATPAAQK